MTKPRVLVAGRLPAAGLELLREHYTVETPGVESLLERAPGVAAIVADPGLPVDAALLDAAGETLAVVANFGVGYDNVDVAAVRARGVRLTNTPDVLTDATAELAVALMLAATRRLVEGDAIVRQGHWRDELLGRGLVGKTVGLVGFGRIGQRVAMLLRGFEVLVLFCDRGGAGQVHGAERRELPELLAASDFVSLHVPLSPETWHLIDAAALVRMKRSAILVNTSRGAVVDEAALIDALRSGVLAGAALDVYEREPEVPAELLELSNTVLLPHVGSSTAATWDAMARLCAENVIAVVDGHRPPAAVV